MRGNIWQVSTPHEKNMSKFYQQFDSYEYSTFNQYTFQQFSRPNLTMNISQ